MYVPPTKNCTSSGPLFIPSHLPLPKSTWDNFSCVAKTLYWRILLLFTDQPYLMSFIHPDSDTTVNTTGLTWQCHEIQINCTMKTQVFHSTAHHTASLQPVICLQYCPLSKSLQNPGNLVWTRKYSVQPSNFLQSLIWCFSFTSSSYPGPF